MLGRLAKWLRILGYDTLYVPSLDDGKLARIARAEGRVLLTRDTQLIKRRGIESLFIYSDDFLEQLRQVVGDLNLNVDNSFTRCPVCNQVLRGIDREDVRERVPPYVFKNQERFSLCPDCGKIYWRGTHWERMRRLLEEAP